MSGSSGSFFQTDRKSENFRKNLIFFNLFLGVFGEDDESETDFALRDAFRRLGLSADLEKAVPGFCQKIESDVKPFLTAASLFYHCLTGIPFAEESAGKKRIFLRD